MPQLYLESKLYSTHNMLPSSLLTKGHNHSLQDQKTSIAFDSFTLHHYDKIPFKPKELCSISDGPPCSEPLCGDVQEKRSTQMLPITDTLLKALLFHHRPGFKANQVSLKASPLSGVLVRTTEELWLYTRLLGPPPWKWTAYDHILLINPFLNSPCNLHIA